MKRELHYNDDDIPIKKAKFDFSPEKCKLETNVKLMDCSVVIKKYDDDFLKEIENKKEFNVKPARKKAKPKTVRCQICQKDMRATSLQNHLRRHELKGPKLGEYKKPIELRKTYICKICNRNCLSKCNLERHLRAHDKRILPCEECPELFKCLTELARHVSREHRATTTTENNIQDRKVECPICGKGFVGISNHLQTHKVGPKKCEICSATLPNYVAYRNHIRCHSRLAEKGRDRPIVPMSYKLSQKPFQCSICHKRMATKEQLQTHQMCHLHIFQSHIDTRIKSAFYNCQMCQFEAQSKLELYFHLIKTHNSISDSECRCLICHQRVKVKYLSSHLRSHAAVKYTCESCSLDFDGIRQYRDHCKQLHGTRTQKKSKFERIMEKHGVEKKNSRKVSCFECRRKVRISHMRQHISLSHFFYKCAMCDKKFSKLDNLKSHEFRHDKCSSRCPVCPQTFLSHIRLLAHLKQTHRIPFTVSKACPRCRLKPVKNADRFQ